MEHFNSRSKVNTHTSSPLWWTTPLRGNADRVIAMAAEEFIVARQAYGGTYTLGALLDYLRKRVPILRAELAAAKRTTARRAHDAAVDKLRENRAAA